MEQEVEFAGHKYKTDGKQIWKDGELLDMKMSETIKSMETITAIKVDDKIYYNERFYE